MKTLPNEIAHADVMSSSIPTLTHQIIGFLASNKYYYSSFFIDDRSDHAFVFHQEPTSASDTIKAKHAYELDLHKFGKVIVHNQTENCIYH